MQHPPFRKTVASCGGPGEGMARRRPTRSGPWIRDYPELFTIIVNLEDWKLDMDYGNGHICLKRQSNRTDKGLVPGNVDQPVT